MTNYGLKTYKYLDLQIHANNIYLKLQGLNQEMREHESSFASEHLRLMVARSNMLEAKVGVDCSLSWIT